MIYLFIFLSQPSLQERTRWLLWKLLYSLRTLESPCRPSASDSTWRYQQSRCMFLTPLFLAFITQVRFLILKYSFLDSRTRRPSLLRTSAVFPRRSSTRRGTWVSSWASTPPTWPRALLSPPWRLNVPVGSLLLFSLFIFLFNHSSLFQF